MYQVKMFTYGTLQRAGSLYELIQPVVLSVQPATLEGYGLYRSRWGIYPEAYPLEGHTIKGELFDIDASKGTRFLEVVMMEARAGYKLEINQVKTPHGLLIDALTFIYREQPTGYLIEDGNWLKHAEQLFKHPI